MARIAWNKGIRKIPRGKCKWCANEFQPVIRSKNGKLTIFCSNRCFADYRSAPTIVNLNCKTCDKKFRSTRCFKNKKYCSRKCMYICPSWLESRAIGKSGPLSFSWKGGVTPTYHRIRSSRIFDRLRREVYKRDGYYCKICKLYFGYQNKWFLEIDHIKPFAYFPKLRHDTNNMRVLCKRCHKKTDTYMDKAKKLAEKNGWAVRC